MVTTKPCGERESLRGTRCELYQFRPDSGNCRRCGALLQRSSVESTTVVYLGAHDPFRPQEVTPMRELMRRAAVAAVRSVGHTTKAAEKLGVPHSRLKQLLREAGDDTDYRKCRLRKPRKSVRRG